LLNIFIRNFFPGWTTALPSPLTEPSSDGDGSCSVSGNGVGPISCPRTRAPVHDPADRRWPERRLSRYQKITSVRTAPDLFFIVAITAGTAAPKRCTVRLIYRACRTPHTSSASTVRVPAYLVGPSVLAVFAHHSN